MSTTFLAEEDVSSAPVPGQRRYSSHVGKLIRIPNEISYTVVSYYPPVEPDTSAAPGVELSPEVMAFVRDRDALRQLAARFITEGFGGAHISKSSAASFALLLEQIPMGGHLPRIAPDEDGALTLQWSFEDRSDILALVDGLTLHVIEAPATPHARYLPSVDLRNGIPPALLRSLGRRHPT